MKFEKFLKQVGTHGTVIERNESEKWLVCDGVGMVIPRGVDNLLGTPTNSEYASIIDVLADVEYDDSVKLKEAILLDPTGNAKAIYRVFETDLGDTVGIINADYGLLEKSDLLGFFEIEIDCDEEGNPLPEDKVITVKYILVFNHTGEIVGYITGSQRF